MFRKGTAQVHPHRLVSLHWVLPVWNEQATHCTNGAKLSGEELPESTLQLVQIYFDTATYDEVERDKKIKTEAQLSLIGGTMGLLTGFSILSGVEILYFLLKFIFSCTTSSKDAWWKLLEKPRKNEYKYCFSLKIIYVLMAGGILP